MKISEKQIPTYLRLKKELAQFRGFGEFFESSTFDWFNLTGTPESAVVRLIMSLDEGDEWHCDVASFETMSDDDKEDDSCYHSGTLEECLIWVESNGGNRSDFVGPGMIDKVYQNQKKTEPQR